MLWSSRSPKLARLIEVSFWWACCQLVRTRNKRQTKTLLGSVLEAGIKFHRVGWYTESLVWATVEAILEDAALDRGLYGDWTRGGICYDDSVRYEVKREVQYGFWKHPVIDRLKQAELAIGRYVSSTHKTSLYRVQRETQMAGLTRRSFSGERE